MSTTAVAALSSADAAPPSLGLSDPPGVAAAELARALDLSRTVAEWLLRRGFDASERTRRFLEPRLEHLSAPDDMADRQAAAERLARAVRRRERICVFGDYDCDGITSTAIMTEMLRALGAEVTPLLASRFDGGYGLSSAAAKRVRDTGAGLLVTCDCGSSDHASLSELSSAGVESIVIDHHLVPEEPLPATAFLNPNRPECGFAFKGMASCGLSLSVGAAVRRALGQKLDLRRWLDLVAIGTIADVAPLAGDNRCMVRAGLAFMRTSPRPGVRALLELSRVDGLSPLTGEDIAFRIAPRLNAPGRLGPPDAALRLLMATSDDSARAMAAEIEQVSERRKAEQERITAEAIEEVEREGYDRAPAIVVGRDGWGHGIVGIVAGRLSARYGRPVVVVGFDGSVGRGSVRGPAGARLHDAISGLSDCLERFGGHQAAAGLEVTEHRLGELRERFNDAFAGGATTPQEIDWTAVVTLSPEDRPLRIVQDLERLEPCGAGNPAPRLGFAARVRDARSVRGGHLKLRLALESGEEIGGFAFDQGKRADDVGETVTVVGALRRDTWRGGDAVEVRVEHLL